MQEQIRDFSVPSPDIPVARERIRALELLFSLLVIAPLVGLFVPTGSFGALVDVGLLAAFVSPPVLALVALVGVVDDGFSVGAVVVALLALTTLSVAFVSVYALFVPTEGGVYGGHLFTLAAGVLLAVGVLVRTFTLFVLRRTDVSS